MPVNATFGQAEYRENGVIAVPLTFPENVVAEKSIVEIARVSGDKLTGLEYRLVGSGTDFSVITSVPPDRSGRFSLNLAGSVFKRTDSVYDQVAATAVKHVDYSTVVPRILDWDIPANYTPDEIFDVKVAFNVPVTGWHANNTFTEIFYEEGARLGTPSPYKWTGTPPTDSNLKTFLETALPDDLTSTDWEGLATPPGGHQGAWHGEVGQYFLIRFSPVDANATGIFQMTLRDGGVRGPVS